MFSSPAAVDFALLIFTGMLVLVFTSDNHQFSAFVFIRIAHLSIDIVTKKLYMRDNLVFLSNQKYFV